MNMQVERIAALRGQLKMASVAADWLALAHNAARQEASFADFLGQVLACEWVACEQRLNVPGRVRIQSALTGCCESLRREGGEAGDEES
jgi:hypothetical protein